MLCTSFFAEYWFILENEIKKLQIIFRISKVEEQVYKVHPLFSFLFSVWCICNSNAMIGITNIFSQLSWEFDSQ